MVCHWHSDYYYHHNSKAKLGSMWLTAWRSRTFHYNSRDGREGTSHWLDVCLTYKTWQADWLLSYTTHKTTARCLGKYNLQPLKCGLWLMTGSKTSWSRLRKDQGYGLMTEMSFGAETRCEPRILELKAISHIIFNAVACPNLRKPTAKIQTHPLHPELKTDKRWDTMLLMLL